MGIYHSSFRVGVLFTKAENVAVSILDIKIEACPRSFFQRLEHLSPTHFQPVSYTHLEAMSLLKPIRSNWKGWPGPASWTVTTKSPAKLPVPSATSIEPQGAEGEHGIWVGLLVWVKPAMRSLVEKPAPCCSPSPDGFFWSRDRDPQV